MPFERLAFSSLKCSPASRTQKFCALACEVSGAQAEVFSSSRQFAASERAPSMTNRRRMPLAIICPLSQQASLEFVLLRTGDLIASNSGVVQTGRFALQHKLQFG
jgi:hypothetical protein